MKKKKAVEIVGHPSDLEAIQSEISNHMAAKYGIPEPKITHLRPLLAALPPMLGRADVAKVLGIPLSAKTLANRDSAGQGPRLRFNVAGKVAYPAAFLLEWIEQQELTPVIRREI